MNSIQVVNKKNGGRGLYIGRPSILGNPFKMNRETERDDVVEQYRVWLMKELKKNGNVRDKIREIARQVTAGETVNLVCWCAPKRCHGDVVKEVVEQVLRGELKLD